MSGICFIKLDRGDSVSRRSQSKTLNGGKYFFHFGPVFRRFNYISKPRLHIATDASGKKGIGGVWFEGEGQNMFSTRLARRHRSKHINWKELFTVLYASAS